MLIAEAAALEALVGRLRSATRIGLDTEFLRERTYFAQLCLLQIAAGEELVCIDPLAQLDLAPLGELLADPAREKVLHAARQDLEVLRPLAATVRPLFDTQVAAALIGMPAQVGYAELVRVLLGVELPKSHTRTDWSQRPLSAAQLDYAIDDVRWLLPLQDELRSRIEAQGRSEWLAEELDAIAAAANAVPDPGAAWRRLRGLDGLDPSRTQLARELATWRERRAIERDRPRGWILDDAVLREIVFRAPRTPEALAAVPGAAPGLVRHCGPELLGMIGACDPGPATPTPRPRPDPEKLAVLRRLADLTREVGATLQLAPELLATRRDLERLLDGDRELAVLRGWRRPVLGERLLAAL